MLNYRDADRLASLLRDEDRRWTTCGWCGGPLRGSGAERSCASCRITVRLEAAPAPLPEDVARLASDTERAVGPYICVGLLGRGGFGAVHRAWDRRLGRWVALKVLAQAGGREAAERFRREAQLAASLSHPGIAHVYEVGEHEGRLWFAMQLVEGESLDRVRLDKRAAASAVRDAARAVDHAHGQGIVHRDLKPANLMRDKTGRILVLDFGLARPLAEDALPAISASGAVLGTPAFMAPEQARGGPPGPPTDVYGLGATLYALLAGRPPHAGPTPAAVLHGVLERDPAPPPGDPELRLVCLKALEKDPARRYPTAGTLADDLDRWLRKEPVRARPPSMLYRLRKRIERQPALWALAALLVTAVAGGAAFGISGLLRSRTNLQRALDAERGARERAELQGLIDRARRRLDDARTELATSLSDERLAALRRDVAAVAGELEAPDARIWTLRGEAWLLLFDDDRAMEDFGRAMTMEPASVRPLAALGRARARLRRILDVSIGEQTYRVWRRHREAAGLLAAALDDLRLAEALPGPQARIAALWAAVAREDLDTLRGEANAAIAIGAAPAEVWLLRSLSRRGQERVADLTEALTRDRGSPRVWFLRGAARHAVRDLDGAIADYDEALRLRPADVHALVNRGVAKFEKGDVHGARADYDRALALDPQSAPAHLNRGNAEPDFERAMSDFARALELDPESVPAWASRGLRRASAGDFKGAIADYDRALRIDPDNSGVLTNRGEALRSLGDLEPALADLDRAVASDETNAYAFVNRGIVKRNLGRVRDAVADYERAIAIDRELALAYANRGNARLELGDRAGAIEDFETFLRLAPRHPFAPEVRERLGRLK
jgi:serine/threonine-protein kinase